MLIMPRVHDGWVAPPSHPLPYIMPSAKDERSRHLADGTPTSLPRPGSPHRGAPGGYPAVTCAGLVLGAAEGGAGAAR